MAVLSVATLTVAYCQTENIFATNWLISNGRAVVTYNAHGNKLIRWQRHDAATPAAADIPTLSLADRLADPSSFDTWVRELGLQNSSPLIPHRQHSVAHVPQSLQEMYNVRSFGLNAPKPIKHKPSTEARSRHRCQDMKDEIVTASQKRARYEADVSPPRTRQRCCF